MNVCITSEAQVKLWTIIESYKTEVGGFGGAYLDEQTNDLIWDDVFLIPQFVSHGEVDFDADSMVAAIDKFGARLDDPKFVPVSWHSHNSMKAFWSATDEKCIKTYGKAGMRNLISFVGNHSHEYKLRFDYFGVEHCGLVIPQITMDEQMLFLDPNDPVYSALFDEMEANVRNKPKPAPKAQSLQQANTQFGTSWDKGKYSNTASGTPEPGSQLERAFEIKGIMDELGVSHKDAVQILDDGWVNWLEDVPSTENDVVVDADFITGAAV